MVEENLGAIAKAVNDDLHTPYTEAVLLEVWDVIAETIYFQKNLESFTKKEKLPTPLNQRPLSFEAWKEPRGVVTIIAPWNFPFVLLLNPLAGALAAGNTCILKPSEISKATCRLLAEIIPRYFDSSAVGVVSGGIDQTTALLAENVDGMERSSRDHREYRDLSMRAIDSLDAILKSCEGIESIDDIIDGPRRVDYIHYTGGGHVGRIVMTAAAKNLTPVTLELGGKCPVYVDQSANLEVAARRIIYMKNLNCGQMCVAPDYVLVHEKVRDAFLEHLNRQHDKLYPGDEKANPDKSRIVNSRHFKRVSTLLEGHGGKVVRGGALVESERYLDFTVITDPAPDSSLMQEEIFGPILPVIKVSSIDQAIAYCRNKPIPLAAYVFERDGAIREQWLAQVESGGACVNDCMYHMEGGFGGKGESGMGSSRGRMSFDAFTHRKVVGIQPNFDIRLKYPPLKKKIPFFFKALLLGELPSWAKIAWRGFVGGTAAGIAYVVTQHVSVSVTSNSITISVH